MSGKYQFVTQIDPTIYDDFVSQHSLRNISQYRQWAVLKPAWTSFICGMTSNDVLVASALVLVRSQYGFKMAYCPRGPIMDYTNVNLVRSFLKSLRLYCADQGISTLIFDPNVIVNSVSIKEKGDVDAFDASWLLDTILDDHHIHFRGFTKDIEATTLPRYNLAMDLNQDMEMVLPKKTKEKIHHYDGHGLTISACQDSQRFYAMVSYTEKRKGIALRNADYFQTLLTQYPSSTILMATLDCDTTIDYLNALKVQYESKLELYRQSAPKKSKQWQNQIDRIVKEIEETESLKHQYGSTIDVAGLLLVHDSKNCELLYSGLNEDFRKYHPAYALRYHALLWAKQHGCQWFNFGGVEGTLDDGLFTFKSAFNPTINVYIGEFVMACRWSNILFEKGLPLLRKWRDKAIAKNKKEGNRL